MASSRFSSSAFSHRGASVLVLAVLTFLPGCRDQTQKPPPPPDTSRTALLGAAGACVLTVAREFLTAAGSLEEKTAALAAGPEAGTRDAARTAYHHAMDVWQQLEVMQVGPAAPRSQPGGAEVRDNVYSWPLTNRCAIEEQLVAKGYESENFASSLVTRRGLFALEYLLFYEGADTACPASSPVVSGGTWAALSAEERAARKRAYAAVVAADVRRRALQLVETWEADKGGYVRTLETAGTGSTVYPTVQLGMNALSDALFYVEREVKDMKLARPLGLRDCSSDSCPELLESAFAGRSKANVRANLVGFRRIFEGCGANYEGAGFDDVLEAAGAGALAVKLKERAVAAQAAVEAIGEPDLLEALYQDKASVRALYESLKGMTDVLKTEWVSVLDLELPQTLEGDND
ncbi:imelysin family protein [Archangium violaceum]|uniref:imelysin family protein n=1 Tax=Archangium violaceum TaxID=83451 RepID=UPI002B2915C4|nr:imelysin family protein [Archangium gephyra]